MKKTALLFITLGLISTQSFALNVNEVEKELQNIEQLPLQERVEKMNELKNKIRHAHEKERAEIIRSLSERHHLEKINHRVDKKALEHGKIDGKSSDHEMKHNEFHEREFENHRVIADRKHVNRDRRNNDSFHGREKNEKEKRDSNRKDRHNENKKNHENKDR